MKARRRRNRLDEESKRRLKKDLADLFSTSRMHYSGPSWELNPTTPNPDLQSQLRWANQFGHNFGKIGVSPQSPQPETDIDPTSHPPTSEQTNSRTSDRPPDSQATDPEWEELDETLPPEQLHDLAALPLALDLEPLTEPFQVLEKLLLQAGEQNPGLEPLLRLRLIWSRWAAYYRLWHHQVLGQTRQAPGRATDPLDGQFTEAGLHDLELPLLENALRHVMAWERGELPYTAQNLPPLPNDYQLHAYFTSLARVDWTTLPNSERRRGPAIPPIDQPEEEEDDPAFYVPGEDE